MEEVRHAVGVTLIDGPVYKVFVPAVRVRVRLRDGPVYIILVPAGGGSRSVGVWAMGDGRS